MGRHSAPSRTGRNVARAAAAGLAAASPLTLVGTANAAAPQSTIDAVARCESGNRNIEHGGDPGGVSTASGFFQFVNGTWRLFGGTEFAPRAIGATRAEQVAVFNRAFDANGLRDWEASRSCWQDKIGRHASGQEATRVSTAPARHAAPSGGDTYVVRRGDTLSEIAAAHHTTVAKLFNANRDVIDDPNRIFPGERIQT